MTSATEIGEGPMDVPQTEQDKRRADITAAMKVTGSPAGLGLTVGAEDAYLLSDAVRCYVNAANAGTIFCVHASCDRDLCANQGLMPSDLLDNLRVLNDHHKTLYHYGHSESDTALRQRTSELIQEIGSSKLREDFKEQRGYEGRQ